MNHLNRKIERVLLLNSWVKNHHNKYIFTGQDLVRKTTFMKKKR